MRFLGDPGAGKTSLMRKIAFDYGAQQSSSPNHFVNKYDIVLMTDFRSTADLTSDNATVIDLVLYGLEKTLIGNGKNICNFIRNNAQQFKLLILLDGYDEARSDQSRLIDKVLSNKIDKLKTQQSQYLLRVAILNVFIESFAKITLTNLALGFFYSSG